MRPVEISRRKEVILMAITPVSAQNISTATLQNQEQQLLNQITNLQKNPQGNAAQIKVLQQKYKALLQQQQQHQQTQAVTSQPQQNVKAKGTDSETKAQQVPGVPSASTAASKGIDIKA
jgi:chromosome segregation and condensation protein ScpB